MLVAHLDLLGLALNPPPALTDKMLNVSVYPWFCFFCASILKLGC